VNEGTADVTHPPDSLDEGMCSMGIVGKIFGRACFSGAGDAEAPRGAKGKAAERAVEAKVGGRPVRVETAEAGTASTSVKATRAGRPQPAASMKNRQVQGGSASSSQAGSGIDLTRPTHTALHEAATAGETSIKIESFGQRPQQTITCHVKTEADNRMRQQARRDEFVNIGAASQARTGLYSDSFGPCVPVVARFPDGVNALYHANSVSGERIGKMTGSTTEAPVDPLDKSGRPWLTTAQPTDVYVVCRSRRVGTAAQKQDGIVKAVADRIRPGTNLHVVTVDSGHSLSVSVDQEALEIWDVPFQPPTPLPRPAAESARVPQAPISSDQEKST
jgi:hypothetical protein